MIQVERFYQDIYGLKVQPGFYNDNDPRLKGRGKYLVEIGFATVVKAQDVPDDALPDAPETDVEFTYHASTLMSEHGISEKAIRDFYPDETKILKSHVEDYIVDTTD